MSKFDWFEFEDMEEDAVIESQKSRIKPKKSWKKVKPELNKKGYEKYWKNKRRDGKKTHHKST